MQFLEAHENAIKRVKRQIANMTARGLPLYQIAQVLDIMSAETSEPEMKAAFAEQAQRLAVRVVLERELIPFREV